MVVSTEWREITLVSHKRLTIVEFDNPDIFLEIVVLRLFVLKLQSPFYKTWCTLGPKETPIKIDMNCLVILCHCDLKLEIVLIF